MASCSCSLGDIVFIGKNGVAPFQDDISAAAIVSPDPTSGAVFRRDGDFLLIHVEKLFGDRLEKWVVQTDVFSAGTQLPAGPLAVRTFVIVS